MIATRPTQREISSWRGWAVGLLLAVAGCAPPGLAPDLSLLPQGSSSTYSDRDFEAVLRHHVRDGLVDYRGLMIDRQQLDRYYALISVTGPTRSPAQFPSRADRTAYWINVYNALVLKAVLERYPVTTMYDLALPSLEYGVLFRVDGQAYTLAKIEAEMLESSAGDVRTLLATSRAALGTPRLLSEPFRPDTLGKQLAQAARQNLDSSDICRIDHASKSILIWQKILQRKQDFLDYWRLRRRVSSTQLYNVLLDLVSPGQRRMLQTAVGYTFRETPFNRQLNDWRSQSSEETIP